MQPPFVKQFQKLLLSWYAQNKRPLPWRVKRSAYRTFVSEVMLQQTQIKTVIPYFERWMKAFPTIQHLARAPLGRVLKLWEGLGYYSRARNLHKSAKIIATQYLGRIPKAPAALMALPGIGPYTAGAIASIAYDKQVPLVDGNIFRVFARIFLIRKDILKPDAHAAFYKVATALVPKKNPGDFNQALMELGSLVCFSSMPNCEACPVSEMCKAYQQNVQESLPVKSKAPKKKKLKLSAGVLVSDGKVLVRQRPTNGIWGGLWEVPNMHAPVHDELETLRAELRQHYGVRLNAEAQKLPLIKRQLTHIALKIQPYKMTVEHMPLRTQGARWATRTELKKLSFPVPYQQILKEALT